MIAQILAEARREFPALSRQINGRPAIYFDGPAGSQVPQRVIDAVANHLARHNANHGGLFATSQESDAIVDDTRRLLALFLNSPDPDEIIFGANMTTLTFALSRALAATWKPGDEVIVTRLDHDANVSPWVLAANDRGVVVRHVEINRDDCSLDIGDFERKLSARTRLVAIGCASNAVGTRNPVQELTRMAKRTGALVFLDAVHLAPHAAVDVTRWGCDFLACSAYKFFGPHVGILWGRRALLESLTPYKVRPAADSLPERWMTGTQNFAGIAGVRAAVQYLFDLTAKLANTAAVTRQSFEEGMNAIVAEERRLGARLIAGLTALPDVRVYGIIDPARFAERVPTLSFTHRRLEPSEVARRLGEQAIFVWHGNFYALPLTEALGLEPDGMVRVGLLHPNSADEIDRFLAAVAEL